MIATLSRTTPSTDDAGVQVGSRAWLEGFPDERRNAIAQFFNRIARQGVDGPEALTVRVAAHVGGRVASGWSDADEQRRMEDYLGALADDFPGACRFAEHVIWWVGLPDAEREKLKGERGRQYQEQAMTAKPPTDRQLAYLRSLGYSGPKPETMAEASRLIDERRRT